MTVVTHEGKTYELGKYYAFSDREEDFAIISKLVEIKTDKLYPFRVESGGSWGFCKESDVPKAEYKGRISIPYVEGELYTCTDPDGDVAVFYYHDGSFYVYKRENGEYASGYNEGFFVKVEPTIK